MKLLLSMLTLTASLAAVTLTAQDAPPPAAPPAPVPGAPPVTPPGLLPPPDAAPAEAPDSFKTEKERQSYALGSFFAAREKNAASAGGTPLPNAAEMVAGLRDVLGGGKSMDYAIGAQLGAQIRRLETDVDLEVLAQAIQEVLTSQPPKLTPQQQQKVIQRIQSELSERTNAKRKADAAKALEAATQFLASNSKAEGIKQTPSGVQYLIEKEGDGKSATADDLVMMNYKATTTDGTVFEKSPETAPARKPVKTLPKGMQEGIALLKTGSKAKFWVPSALGYGETGRPPHVKGNAVVVYEVELLGVEPLPKQPVAGTPPSRPPVTAVTPPITVEIPPRPGDKPDAPKPKDAPKPPAPPAPPEKK